MNESPTGPETGLSTTPSVGGPDTLGVDQEATRCDRYLSSQSSDGTWGASGVGRDTLWSYRRDLEFRHVTSTRTRHPVLDGTSLHPVTVDPFVFRRRFDPWREGRRGTSYTAPVPLQSLLPSILLEYPVLSTPTHTHVDPSRVPLKRGSLEMLSLDP